MNEKEEKTSSEIESEDLIKSDDKKNDENYDEWIKQWKRHGKWARFLHCSCIIDGYNKYPFHFKTSVRFPMQPFEYKEVSSSLKDLMYQRAEN